MGGAAKEEQRDDIQWEMEMGTQEDDGLGVKIRLEADSCSWSH